MGRHTGLWFVLLSLVGGCASATSSTRTPDTAPQPMAQARMASGSSAQDPPNTQRVRGPGWSLAIPEHWEQTQDQEGNPRWTTLVGPGSTNRWIIGVGIAREQATFDQLVDSLPGQFRLRSGTTEAPRRFTHKGRPAAEFVVYMPGETTQSRVYASVMHERERFLVAICSGATEAIAPTCQTVLNSAYLGNGPDDRPSRPAAAGMHWFGHGGRFLQVPTAWNQEHEDDEHHTYAVGNEEDTQAALVVVLDDFTGPPNEMIERLVQSLGEDRATSVIRRTPFRRGVRSGVLVEATRAEVTTPTTTLLQWVIPAGGDRYYTLVCGAPTDSFAGSPDTCRDVFRTFGYENTQ